MGSQQHIDDGIVRRHGANLPHWTREGATYSVTFRLSDSLPADVVHRWVLERDVIVRRAAAAARPLSVVELRRLDELHSERVEGFLDAGSGECYMRQPRIASIVEDAMRHFDRHRYDLLAWCVMPNHVHAVLRPRSGFGLSSILHSWKSFSASEANKVLGRSGTFWQPESYDHLIRDSDDFGHAVRYVLDNPAKAGLSGWRWVGYRAGDAL